MVIHLKAVQLKDESSIRNQLFVFGPSVIAPAAKQTLVPQAAFRHVGNSDESLRPHF
jgi:hypothetical protein